MDFTDVLTREEQRAVVEHLYRLTTEGRVTWKLGSRDDEFDLAMGAHSYRLSSKDHDGVLPYQIEIFISADNEQLATILTKSTDNRHYDQFVTESLRAMYEIIYRYTHRSESHVKSLLSELEKIDEGELPPF